MLQQDATPLFPFFCVAIVTEAAAKVVAHKRVTAKSLMVFM